MPFYVLIAKSLPTPMVSKILSITVLTLTCKFMTYLDLILYIVGDYEVNIFSLYLYSYFSTICCKDFQNPIEFLEYLCYQSIVLLDVCLFLASLFCFIERYTYP